MVHSPRSVYSIGFINNTAGAQPTFYLDEVVFADSGAPPPLPPDLSIDAAADVHPISPYIYGMNFALTDVATEVRLPVRRWGGNSTTRFNWQIDVHNTGSDWYFENIPDAPGTIDNTVNQDLNTWISPHGTWPRCRIMSRPMACASWIISICISIPR